MAKKPLTPKEKKKLRNQKRNLNRRIKYALIRNITGDDKLAKNDRDLGWVKLKEKYGISDKPKKAPKLIPIKRVQRLIIIGREIALPTVKIPDYSEEIKTFRTREERKYQWELWAKGDGKISKFPFKIRNIAKQINARQIDPRKEAKLVPEEQAQPFDDYAGYGFAVVWYAYVETGSLDEETLLFYEQQSIPDRHEGEMYTPPSRLI